MSKVLVVFQANTEQVEQLALAAAVGAVEAKALIRLRRLAAADAPEVGHKSYGRLQAGDLLWADAVLIFLEDARPNFEELDPMLDLLSEAERPEAMAWTLRADGVAAPKTEAQATLEKALIAAGFTMMPFEDAEESADPLPRMKLLGRQAATPGAKAAENH
jgi:hypothetical protein